MTDIEKHHKAFKYRIHFKFFECFFSLQFFLIGNIIGRTVKYLIVKFKKFIRRVHTV